MGDKDLRQAAERYDSALYESLWHVFKKWSSENSVNINMEASDVERALTMLVENCR